MAEEIEYLKRKIRRMEDCMLRCKDGCRQYAISMDLMRLRRKLQKLEWNL